MNPIISNLKTLVFFLLITFIIFWFANSYSRAPASATIETNLESANEFLTLVDRLKEITFDLEFLNSVSLTSLTSYTTEIEVERINGYGRVNPFQVNSASINRNTVTNTQSIDENINNSFLEDEPSTEPTPLPTLEG